MDLCRQEVAEFGIDLANPLVIQVSRFDPWKDPLGVADAFRLARQQVSGLQLALVGVLADDDPEGWEIYRNVHQLTEQDRDIHLLTNLNGVGAHEVNTFQGIADVVFQISIREGF
jgi:trehalose synthase